MFFSLRTLTTLAIGLLAAAWLAGCVQSMPLPPAPTPGPSGATATPQTSRSLSHIPPTLSIPAGGVNPWKPSAPERAWKFIVLHHTAADKGDVESIHQTHLARKDGNGKPWLGIGYHFVIGNGQGMPNGEIEPTFRWRQQLQGAHAGASDPKYNQNGIGIVLIGNFEKSPPTRPQVVAVRKLVRYLTKTYHLPSQNIIGHRDIRATECPGKLFPMSEILAAQGSEPDFIADPSQDDEARQILHVAHQKEAAYQ